MITSFQFKGINITYNSTIRTVLPDNAQWGDRYNIEEPEEGGDYFDIQLSHENFDATLYLIFSESNGYVINSYVSRGSEFLKTLHHAVRLKAKKELLSYNEVYLTQLKIAKLKKAEPPRKLGVSIRKRTSIFGTPLHSKLYTSSIEEINTIVGFDIKELLLEEYDAIDVGTKSKITRDNSKSGKSEFVSFEKGNFKLLIVLFILTRLYPVSKEIYADD